MKPVLPLIVLLLGGCGTFFGNPSTASSKPKGDTNTGGKALPSPTRSPAAALGNPFDFSFAVLPGPLASTARLRVVALAFEASDGAWLTADLERPTDLSLTGGATEARLQGRVTFPVRSWSRVGLVLASTGGFRAESSGALARDVQVTERVATRLGSDAPLLVLSGSAGRISDKADSRPLELEVGFDMVVGLSEADGALRFRDGALSQAKGVFASLSVKDVEEARLPLCVRSLEPSPLAGGASVCAGEEARNLDGALVFPFVSPGSFELVSGGVRIASDLFPLGIGKLAPGERVAIVAKSADLSTGGGASASSSSESVFDPDAP